MSPKIAIKPFDSTCVTKAKILAKQLQLPISTDTQYSFWLVVAPSHLEIQHNASPYLGPLRIDFLTGATAYRLNNAQSTEALVKAVGIKPPINIIDATAGLGRDGFLLATLGYRVLLLEKSNLLAVLLQDALNRALSTEKYQNLIISLINTDAKQYLQMLSENKLPEVIYLDPMFPERRKSAAVKKEMQYLQQLIDSDDNNEELLTIALNKAKKKVIVKRPTLAPHLANIKPHHCIEGKNIRFDVYMTKTK